MVDPELEGGPSDFDVNFLGFLRSPLVDAGGLFSLLGAEVACFDWVDAVGLFAVCGLEAAFGGDFFDSTSVFEAGSFGLEDGAFDCDSCFEGEDSACAPDSACCCGADVRCDLRGCGLASFGDSEGRFD